MLLSSTIFIAKGIGIILVVIGHYGILGGVPSYWSNMVDVIYTFHMPLFMVLSGYLYGSSGGDPSSIVEYRMLLRKKARRLLIPYITITVILIVLKIIGGHFFILSYPLDSDILQYIFLNPAGGFSFLLWFIYTLFMIFLIFPILRVVFRNYILLFVTVLFLSFLRWPKIFSLNHLFHFLPYFTVGFIMMRIEFFKAFRTWRVGLLSFVIFVAAVSLRSLYEAYPIVDNFFSLTLGFSGSLLIITFSQIIDSRRSYFSVIFFYFGVYSITIYLTHSIFMGVVRIFLDQVVNIGHAFFLSSALTASVVGLLLPIALEKYLIRISPILTMLFLGIEWKKFRSIGLRSKSCWELKEQNLSDEKVKS